MPNCNTKHTAAFGVQNNTQDTVIVGWVQGLCDLPTIPAGYTRDTGLIPLTTGPGASTVINDLCSDKGILIAITHGSIAVKVRHVVDGREQDLRGDMPRSPAGQYKPYYIWTLDKTPSLNAEGNMELTISLLGHEAQFSPEHHEARKTLPSE